MPQPKGWGGLKKSLAIAGPLAAIGGGALAVGDKFHQMRRAIVTGTGASGESLKILERSAKRVGKKVADDFTVVGEAIAEMNTATGATGKPLEDMTKAILDASRALGEDGVANSTAFGRAMRSWERPAKDGADIADTLFVATQNYGVSLGELSGQLTTYGPVLKNANFSMEESADLFGQLSKSGIDVSRVMPGLNAAFRKWADQGKDSRVELEKTVKTIKNTEDSQKALSIATEAFGAEGAQRLTTAIKNGSFEIDKLGDSLEGSKGAIEENDKANRDWRESLARLRNKGLAYVEPIATRLFRKLNQGASWLERNLIPAIKDFTKWARDNEGVLKAAGITLASAVVAVKAYQVATKLATLWTNRQRIAQTLLNKTLLLNPIGLVVAALVALGVGLVVAYKKSDRFRAIVDKAWAGIKNAVRKAWDGYIKPALKALWSFIRNDLIPVVKWLWQRVVKPYFKSIGAAIKFAWQNVIKPVFRLWWDFVSNVIGPALKALWDRVVKPTFQKVGSFIKTTWQNVIKPPLRALWEFTRDKVLPGFRKAIDGIKSAWDSIKSAARKPINFVIDTVYNNGIRRAFNAIASALKMDTRMPHAPTIGSGGGGTSRPTPGPRVGGIGGAGPLPAKMQHHAEDGAGGPFGWAKNALGNLKDKGIGWLVDKIKGTVNPLLKRIGDSPWAGLMGGMAKSALGMAVDFIRGNDKVKSAASKPKKGTKGQILPRGQYSIGMPYLGYPGHYGADYPAATGTPVRAYGSGVVTRARSLTGSYGKHVFIDHGDGIQTRYAHLAGFGVRTGQRIAAGARLGAVGSTGNSTGPHLHFEYLKNGSPRNPAGLGVFDRGGKLPTGLSAVFNGTGRQENVLTDQQWSDVHTLAKRGGEASTHSAPTIVQNFPTSSTPESVAAASGGRMVAALSARGL